MGNAILIKFSNKLIFKVIKITSKISLKCVYIYISCVTNARISYFLLFLRVWMRLRDWSTLSLQRLKKWRMVFNTASNRNKNSGHPRKDNAEKYSQQVYYNLKHFRNSRLLGETSLIILYWPCLGWILQIVKAWLLEANFKVHFIYCDG